MVNFPYPLLMQEVSLFQHFVVMVEILSLSGHGMYKNKQNLMYTNFPELEPFHGKVWGCKRSSKCYRKLECLILENCLTVPRHFIIQKVLIFHYFLGYLYLTINLFSPCHILTVTVHFNNTQTCRSNTNMENFPFSSHAPMVPISTVFQIIQHNLY